MDCLSEMCKSGRDNATYLWQVLADESVRRKIAAILPEIKVVEILQDGFDRLARLWAAAKSDSF